MTLSERLRAALRRKPKAEQHRDPYREPAETHEALAAELEASLVANALRIRALERQIEALDQVPPPTFTGQQLLEVTAILEGLARCEPLVRWNTLELRYLARSMRELARRL